MPFFEEIEIGHRREIGAYTFTAESIKTFAQKFDPQRFHLDEEEGKNSLFGGLAASGWHVGSACMSLLVADGQRLARVAAARGEEVAVWGPSPGFRDLRWIRPVLAGDTVSYANVVIDKRTSASRPGWGILTARTTGTNQRGEEGLRHHRLSLRADAEGRLDQFQDERLKRARVLPARYGRDSGRLP
ncbi:MaoC family dehydratase [Bradyrhizobium diazoefficiens]